MLDCPAAMIRRLPVALPVLIAACVPDTTVPGPVPTECNLALAHGKALAEKHPAGPVVAVDLVDFCCSDADPLPPPAPATSAERPDFGALHDSSARPIVYDEAPPASGTHRGDWGKWGEYAFLPPQRWLHNVEHGGAALLYHPCAPKEVVDALRQFARNRPPDDGGAFRWVLSPYPRLPSRVAVVVWRARWLGPDVDTTAFDPFLRGYYRKAPEDFGFEGGYDVLWLGK
jgi:hypothetical protein